MSDYLKKMINSILMYVFPMKNTEGLHNTIFYLARNLKILFDNSGRLDNSKTMTFVIYFFKVWCQIKINYKFFDLEKTVYSRKRLFIDIKLLPNGYKEKVYDKSIKVFEGKHY